jgi:uncharacterized membrane protein
MLPYGKIIGAIAFASAFLGYQFLIHKVTLSGQLTPFGATLVFIPFVIATGWAIAHELGLRLALLITSAMTITGLALVAMFGLPPAIIFGVPHLVTNLFLLWFFARTLKDGREPLITSISRRIRGSMPPDIEIYTRRVTIAWSLFFALQVTISLGLYMFASLEAWSVFINILNSPLIVLMFLCEYSYRILRFRDHKSTILSGLEFFSRGKPASKSTKVG